MGATKSFGSWLSTGSPNLKQRKQIHAADRKPPGECRLRVAFLTDGLGASPRGIQLRKPAKLGTRIEGPKQLWGCGVVAGYGGQKEMVRTVNCWESFGSVLFGDPLWS